MSIEKSQVFFWFLTGFLCFLSLPVFFAVETNYYAKQEPFYHSPLGNRRLELRHDGYGKGYFGASRNKGRLHEGVDFLAPVGTPVSASKSGRVLSAVKEKGYGNYLEILHPDGLRTRYAHLASLKVKEGDWVRRDEPVGLSGKSGNASNPHIKAHLHFEIRSETSPINPATLLK